MIGAMLSFAVLVSDASFGFIPQQVVPKYRNVASCQTVCLLFLAEAWIHSEVARSRLSYLLSSGSLIHCCFIESSDLIASTIEAFCLIDQGEGLMSLFNGQL